MVAIYFKRLAEVPPLEILAHRIVWSVVVLAAIITLLRRWPVMMTLLRNGRALRLLLLSTAFVATNWYVFIWAVTQNRLVDASLGYFINPLVNVVLGFLFLGERLRGAEWVSVALAALAVSYLAAASGSFPWISLTVAATFGLYGLMRKIAAVPSLEGLTVETTLLMPVSAAYLMFLATRDALIFGEDSMTLDVLLLASGPITALPLLWFAAAVRRLRLATVGLLQYISPSIQFLLAVLVYREPFGKPRFVAFLLIWLAVAIYSASNLRREAVPRTA